MKNLIHMHMVACPEHRKETNEQEKLYTMEGDEPEGVGGNKLSSNTTPVATTNNSDFGSVCSSII